MKAGLLVTFVLLLFVQGCLTGDSTSTTPPSTYGSCDSVTQSQCYDFTGSVYANNTILVQETCEQFGGDFTYAATTCSTSSQVGTCTQSAQEDDTLLIHFYTTGGTPFTADSAQSACTEDGGTFSTN